ncbi:MAG: hypothetical protein ACRDTP_00225, partial [Mycobacteriales bacterium]
VPAFDDVVRRRRHTTRQRLTKGSATLLVAGVAGAGVYVALPGTPASPGRAQLSAAATATDSVSQPTPGLADGVCSNVRISLPSDSGGSPDPVAATQQFARNSRDGYPKAGWHVTYQATNVAQVESGAFDALVVRGPDGTWQVLSAQRCG